MKRFVPFAIGLAFWLASPPPAPASSSGFAWLFTGYVGSPAAPTVPTSGGSFVASSGVVTIANNDLVSVKVESTSGADGDGTVEIQTRDCPTCGWYVQATCTNPPDSSIKSTRCNYTLADAYQMQVLVSVYNSGTFRASVRTKNN